MDALRPTVDWITSLELGHPLRVGLDGPLAASKTTLADVLAFRDLLLRPLGRRDPPRAHCHLRLLPQY